MSDNTRKQPRDLSDFSLGISLSVGYSCSLLVQIILSNVCSCPTVRRRKGDAGRSHGSFHHHPHMLEKVQACEPRGPH